MSKYIKRPSPICHINILHSVDEICFSEKKRWSTTLASHVIHWLTQNKIYSLHITKFIINVYKYVQATVFSK